MGKSKTMSKKLTGNLEVLDEMLTALVELLEEKGIITWDEWEERIKRRTVDRIEQEIYEKVKARLAKKGLKP